MTGPIVALPVQGGIVRQSDFEAMAQGVVNRTVRGPAGEPVLPVLPPAAERANKPLAFNGAGDPIALAGVIDPGAVTVSTFGESLVGAADAAAARVVMGANFFTHGASLTVVRSLQSLASEGLSIRDFDASASLGNGVYDATLAMQRLAAECAANGWVGMLPAGDFVITAPVVFDEGTALTLEAPRGSLRGSGANQTRITAASGDYVALDFLGGASGGIAYNVNPGGFYLRKLGGKVGTGMRLNSYAWSEFDNIMFDGFETCVIMADVLSTLFRSVFFRGANRGLSSFFEDFSRPNAITLINCNIGNNSEYGAIFTGPSTLNVIGGAVEYNGFGATGTRGGIFLVNGGVEGASGAHFKGVYFEFNGGIADVQIDHTANRATYGFDGCTFNRISSTTFVTNNIAVIAGGSSNITVGVRNCGFEGFNTYVEAEGRKYIAVSSTQARVVDQGGNLFANDLAYQDMVRWGPGTRSGRLNAGGAGISLPRGWSSSTSGTGVYTVTHNLDTTDYAVLASSNSANADIVQRVTVSANNFTIVTTTAAGAAVNAETSFLLTRTAN